MIKSLILAQDAELRRSGLKTWSTATAWPHSRTRLGRRRTCNHLSDISDFPVKNYNFSNYFWPTLSRCCHCVRSNPLEDTDYHLQDGHRPGKGLAGRLRRVVRQGGLQWGEVCHQSAGPPVPPTRSVPVLAAVQWIIGSELGEEGVSFTFTFFLVI